MAYLEPISALIANGTSLSAAIPIGNKTLVGIGMPAAWTAATLTFQVTLDGSTFLELVDSSGTAISLTVAAGTYIELDPKIYEGFNQMKVRSGTSGSPVNQGADRTLTLETRVVG